jgi:hypothetical protein
MVSPQKGTALSVSAHLPVSVSRRAIAVCDLLPPEERRIVFTMPLDMPSGKFPPRGLVLRAKKWFTDKMSRFE